MICAPERRVEHALRKRYTDRINIVYKAAVKKHAGPEEYITSTAVQNWLGFSITGSITTHAVKLRNVTKMQYAIYLRTMQACTKYTFHSSEVLMAVAEVVNTEPTSMKL